MMIRMKWMIILFFPLGLLAQKKPCSCSLSSILSAGIAAGESPAQPLLQWSGGVNYERFFAGLGAGADWYRFKSIPVFGDLRYSIGKMNSVFVYLNGGYNFPFDTKASVTWDHPFLTTDKYAGGFYMDAGMGYRVRVSGSHNFLLSAGFSHKRISQLTGYTYPCLVEPCPEDLYKKRYDLGRVLTRISWEFNSRAKPKN
ncbi:MAG TPA: hypothetical protein VFX58_10730 [Chitinophagaceae bacterium]|nr:hypothetical protein [Chitinophagaceae bacterium]